jgi:hypothetical protein
MFRRVVPILLVPVVLLSQWAGLVHCHGADQPPGHGSVPHIHIGEILSIRPMHHHHDAPEREDADHGEPCNQSTLPPEHDDDAVYIPVVPATIATPSQYDLAIQHGAVAALPADFLTPLLSPVSAVSPRTHSPPGSHPGACPLYLQILTLLI